MYRCGFTLVPSAPPFFHSQKVSDRIMARQNHKTCLFVSFCLLMILSASCQPRRYVGCYFAVALIRQLTSLTSASRTTSSLVTSLYAALQKRTPAISAPFQPTTFS